MGLPTSGFPNVTAIGMRDEVGKPYLTVNLFITRGFRHNCLCLYYHHWLWYYVIIELLKLGEREKEV